MHKHCHDSECSVTSLLGFDTSSSRKQNPFILRVYESRGSMASKTSVQLHNTAGCHNPENYKPNNENQKTCRLLPRSFGQKVRNASPLCSNLSDSLQKRILHSKSQTNSFLFFLFQSNMAGTVRRG